METKRENRNQRIKRITIRSYLRIAFPGSCCEERYWHQKAYVEEMGVTSHITELRRLGMFDSNRRKPRTLMLSLSTGHEVKLVCAKAFERRHDLSKRQRYRCSAGFIWGRFKQGKLVPQKTTSTSRTYFAAWKIEVLQSEALQPRSQGQHWGSQPTSTRISECSPIYCQKPRQLWSENEIRKRRNTFWP